MRITLARRTASAFTLIELTISAALAAMILVAGYMCLSSAISTRKLIEPRVEIFQNARVAMSLISADLRSACPLSKDFDFLGTSRTLGDVQADNLDFATHNYTPQHEPEADFCEVSFYLEKNPESGQYILWRRRNPTISVDPLAGGNIEEIARGLRGVKFEYYDGFDWYDSWGDLDGRKQRKGSSKVEPNLEGMPEAVRITLSFDANPRSKAAALTEEVSTSEPPLVFQTVARLELAAINEARSKAAPTAAPQAPSPAPSTPAADSGGQTQ